MALDPNQIAKIKHVTSLATRMAAELNLTIRYMSIDNGTVNFFSTKDGSGTPAFSFNFPEELYLSQVGTTVVENFTWSALTYPNSTNPNLDGKVVLVLAVKGDATNPTVKYNFVDLSKLIDVYAPADKSIAMSGHSIAVNLSADADNAIKLTNDGLMVDISGKVDKVANATQGNIAIFGQSGAIANSGLSLADVTSVDVSGKVDKVTSAVAGNFAIFGQSGAIIDSGFTFASDADVEAAFDSILNGDSNNGLHLLAGFADNTEQNFILENPNTVIGAASLAADVDNLETYALNNQLLVSGGGSAFTGFKSAKIVDGDNETILPISGEEGGNNHG